MSTNPRAIYLIVVCITLVTLIAAGLGAWLTSKGYQGGELLIGTCGTGLGGLIAMLSSTRSNPTEPVKTTVVNPVTNPVETHDSTK